MTEPCLVEGWTREPKDDWVTVEEAGEFAKQRCPNDSGSRSFLCEHHLESWREIALEGVSR